MLLASVCVGTKRTNLDDSEDYIEPFFPPSFVMPCMYSFNKQKKKSDANKIMIDPIFNLQTYIVFALDFFRHWNGVPIPASH